MLGVVALEDPASLAGDGGRTVFEHVDEPGPHQCVPAVSLPWIPMSPLGWRLRSSTYSAGGVLTAVVFAQGSTSGRDEKTCLGDSLMNVANGSTSELGQ